MINIKLINLFKGMEEPVQLIVIGIICLAIGLIFKGITSAVIRSIGIILTAFGVLIILKKYDIV